MISQGEVRHSGCLRAKVEGGKRRTLKTQCPESLAPVKPKIITTDEGAVLFQTVFLFRYINNKFKTNNYYYKATHLNTNSAI